MDSPSGLDLDMFLPTGRVHVPDGRAVPQHVALHPKDRLMA